MNQNCDSKLKTDSNLHSITGDSGSHPLGTGVGAATGAVAGAAIGCATVRYPTVPIPTEAKMTTSAQRTCRAAQRKNSGHFKGRCV